MQLVFDEHDVGFSCPQCETRYVVEYDQGAFTLVVRETGGTARPITTSEEPANEAPPGKPEPSAPAPAVATPPSRGPLVASVLTIGMVLGLCGGLVGGVGLAAALYAALLRPG
jgi:hypothetical protein